MTEAKTLTIRTTKKARHVGYVTVDGRSRPVRFSVASWCWYYTDTAADAPVEKIEGPAVLLRR